ncbi:MAG: hypothetical protein JXB30_01385 [Anaerolineae bacterium]|nr:hypothetical protein [Anaerolineae bacterium]
MSVDLTYQSRYDCAACPTRCDGRSKSAYSFEDDVALSERAENQIRDRLLLALGLSVRKAPARAHGLPDLELARAGQVIGRVEVKVQRRTFMSVERLLPESGLRPYETVVLNLSDLKRYIALLKSEAKPIFVIWWVNRPCIGEGYWGHQLEVLTELLHKYGDRRRFRRASTQSDIVDGVHKGVTVNYHFSLRELLSLDDIMPLLAAI